MAQGRTMIALVLLSSCIANQTMVLRLLTFLSVGLHLSSVSYNVCCVVPALCTYLWSDDQLIWDDVASCGWLVTFWNFDNQPYDY